MSNVQILTLMPKKIEFLFRKKSKHASRAKNSSIDRAIEMVDFNEWFQQPKKEKEEKIETLTLIYNFQNVVSK